jgi:hypothetical protein
MRTTTTDQAETTPANEPPPHIEQLTTTIKTKDYLSRLLVNPTPGTSNATDYLGRAVTAGNHDYLGRNLN